MRRWTSFARAFAILREQVQRHRAICGVPKNPLTLRERQVLQLIAEGKSTRVLALILGISIKTAESHRTRLMQKLDIHETASLVRYAFRRTHCPMNESNM
jgi:DNA-binding CsgD family transcriptional regulator